MSEQKPTVYIFGMGGTIAGMANDDLAITYQSGTLELHKIVDEIPELFRLANIKTKQVLNVNSPDITFRDNVLLAKEISNVIDDENVSGVVITHGTDTLEETAYFLNLILNTKKPIVVTGAMRAPGALNVDGVANLYDSVNVAITEMSRSKGVLVVFNSRIYDSRNIVKFDSENVDAFKATNGGEIGSTYGGIVKFYYKPFRKHTFKSKFNDINKIAGKQLPRVPIVYSYMGHDPVDVLEGIYNNDNIDGIVIAGSGNGNVSIQEEEVLIKLADKGVKVVRSSRAFSGNIIKDSFDQCDTKYGMIPSDNLTPVKARILLMLALTITKETSEIEKIFNKY